MKSKGTAHELASRRRLAVQRGPDGGSNKDVAALLGVCAVTVGKGMARHRTNRDAGLAAKPTPGRPPFLTRAQEKTVLGWPAGPRTTRGFRTDLGTAERVVELIPRKLAVRSHPHYLRAW